MRSLGEGALEWLSPGGRPRAEAAFCEWLLQQVQGSEGNAEKLACCWQRGLKALPRMVGKLCLEKSQIVH